MILEPTMASSRCASSNNVICSPAAIQGADGQPSGPARYFPNAVCTEIVGFNETVNEFGGSVTLLVIKTNQNGVGKDCDIWLKMPLESDSFSGPPVYHIRVNRDTRITSTLPNSICLSPPDMPYHKSIRYVIQLANVPTAKEFLRFICNAGVDEDTEIGQVQGADEKSVFDDRTEESSASQYFQFYGYLSQQQNMMQDYIRTSTYQRAILGNPTDFQNKIVLDVGAGSGILSFFAAQAGAKRIYAVEASTMAEHCRVLVRQNNLAGRMIVVQAKMEEITFPEKIDVIISEPIGYMLINERMLETFVNARKWLQPYGRMFPTASDLFVAPFTDEPLHMEVSQKASFWVHKAFHGVDISSMHDEALKEYFHQPVVDSFDIRHLMAQPIAKNFNFEEISEESLHVVEIAVEFIVQHTGIMHGLAFWFDAQFIGTDQTVVLTTAPNQPLTHWYQVRCLFAKPLLALFGQKLSGKVFMKANQKQSYDITLEMRNETSGDTTTNTLDLKNPYFRYTGYGTASDLIPGADTGATGPTDVHWGQQAEAEQHSSDVTMVNSEINLLPTENSVSNAMSAFNKPLESSQPVLFNTERGAGDGPSDEIMDEKRSQKPNLAFNVAAMVQNGI